MALKQRIQEFIRQMTDDGRHSRATITAYEYELNRFVNFIGDRAVDKLGETDVRMYAMRLANASRAGAQRRAFSVLTTFFKWLLARRYVADNPMSGIVRPRGEVRRPRCCRAAGIEQLVEAVEEVANPLHKARDQAIIGLMLGAGLRLSEVALLNREDVDLAVGIVTVPRGRASREIPINAHLEQLLIRHLLNVPKETGTPLFVNHKGTRLSKDGVYYLVKRYTRAAGLDQDGQKVSPHTLRHTFCAQLLRQGANPAVVKELAGFTDLASVAAYMEISPDDKRAAVALLTSPK